MFGLAFALYLVHPLSGGKGADMNRISAFLLLCCCAIGFAQAQQIKSGATVHNDGAKGIHVTFHVTSVRYEEDSTVCDTGECSATKFTIEGYANGAPSGSRIAYVLTCDEFVVYKPTPHITLSCGSVHANNDYDARVFGDSISFWPEDKYTPPPLRGLYNIVSEQEVSKPGK
jgi:hypothetical protein